MTKEQEDQLIRDYPLAVKFPTLSGPHWMLNWWTHDDQNHLSVAKDLKGLVAIFRSLIEDKQERHDDAKPVAVWGIDIVRPPRALELKAAKINRKHEIALFRGWLARSAGTLLRAGRALPQGVKICKSYDPPKDYDLKDDFSLEHHFACKNCEQKITFKTSDFYPLLRDRFLADYRYLPYKQLRASVAHPADLSEPLYEVHTEHGHHQDGAGLRVVKKNDMAYFNEPLFFCHAQKAEMPTEILKLRAERDAVYAARDAKRKADIEDDIKYQEEKELARASKVFE